MALGDVRATDRRHEELRGAALSVSRVWGAQGRHGRRHRADCRPGDISLLPSGHDAWVVGDEAAVVVDFQGMVDYALGQAAGSKGPALQGE